MRNLISPNVPSLKGQRAAREAPVTHTPLLAADKLYFFFANQSKEGHIPADDASVEKQLQSHPSLLKTFGFSAIST